MLQCLYLELDSVESVIGEPMTHFIRDAPAEPPFQLSADYTWHPVMHFKESRTIVGEAFGLCTGDIRGETIRL
jgi:hypothetical protein